MELWALCLEEIKINCVFISVKIFFQFSSRFQSPQVMPSVKMHPAATRAGSQGWGIANAVKFWFAAKVFCIEAMPTSLSLVYRHQLRLETPATSTRINLVVPHNQRDKRTNDEVPGLDRHYRSSPSLFTPIFQSWCRDRLARTSLSFKL